MSFRECTGSVRRACARLPIPILIGVIGIASGCAEDPTEPPQPASAQAVGSTTWTAAAGATISPAPAVAVQDSRGRGVEGVAVGFEVLTGGGTVANATATTDAQGHASSGGWTLGTAMGPQTLRATAAGLTPVIFTASATAGAPEQLTATGGGQTAEVGEALATPPVVTVRDAHDNPVAGVAVAFAVTAGGGTVASDTTTTDAEGKASAGGWTLGPTAGTQTLRATVAGLTLDLSATATPGAAASISIAAGDGQTGLTGALTAVAPAVVVKDGFGNGVPDTIVTFEVVTGSGAVTGATATTSATGTATVGSWRLGVVPGQNSLRARVGTLTASITATASLPSGCAIAPYEIGATISTAWEANDCESPGNRGLYDPAGAVYDQYEVTFATEQHFRIQLTGANERSVRVRRKDTGSYVQLMASAGFTPPTSNPLEIRYALNPGTYIIEVQSPAAGTLGDYTLESFADAELTCMPVTFGVLGTTYTDSMDDATDCPFMGGYEDRIILIFETGDKMKITLNPTTFAPILVLRDDRLGPDSPTLAVRSSQTPGTPLEIDWTATFSGFYEIIVSRSSGQGAYTLDVERVP